MAKKISVSIPDDLYDQLQEVKGAFKVSQVCQEALSHAVRYASLSKSKDIAALKTRLEEEKRQFFKPTLEEGFKAGVRDAFSLNYEQAVSCLEYATIPNDGEFYTPIEYYGSKETNERWVQIENGDLGYTIDLTFEDESRVTTEAFDMYVTGWREGAVSVLKQVL